jgi:hypothetical protein
VDDLNRRVFASLDHARAAVRHAFRVARPGAVKPATSAEFATTDARVHALALAR